MNICSLSGFNVQLCRRAAILCRRRALLVPVSLPAQVAERDTHDGLYHMEPCRPKFCQNAEVLRAVNCNISRKSVCEDKEPCEKKDPCDKEPDDSKKKYLIAAALAALGIGGAILYFMKGAPDKTRSDSSAIVEGGDGTGADKAVEGGDGAGGGGGGGGDGAGVEGAGAGGAEAGGAGAGDAGAGGAGAGGAGAGGAGDGSGGDGGAGDGDAGAGAGGAGTDGAGSGDGGGEGANAGAEEKPKGPPTSLPRPRSALPAHVPYLLIGGGTASFSAFRAIKSNDATAKVLMITDEYRQPYMRPPLSKELWYSAKGGDVDQNYRFKQWTGAERSLYFEPDEFFLDPDKLMDSANGGIAVAQGYKVRKIDPTKRIVTLHDGTEIGYDECLIATGCKPKNLEVFLDATPAVKDKVMVYRTPEDFERLKAYADAKKDITIVGNGFIGSELSCSLANYNKDVENSGRVFQIFPETANMSKVLPDYLSKWTMQKVKSQGVCVIPGVSIKNATRDNSHLKLFLSSGDTILTDVVVVCVGCEANTGIARPSKLEVCSDLGGFVVNAELEARRNLFVAGDASCFYDPLLGRRRVEHHDHSVVSGRLAGENMVGKKKPYAHQSMFWSDLGPEIGYEGIGLVDSSLPTVGVFALPSEPNRETDNLTEERSTVPDDQPLNKDGNLPKVKCDPADRFDYGRGVIFYLKNDKIVGILLWNIFNRIGLARTIINQNQTYEDLNEVAKLFEIHS